MFPICVVICLCYHAPRLILEYLQNINSHASLRHNVRGYNIKQYLVNIIVSYLISA